MALNITAITSTSDAGFDHDVSAILTWNNINVYILQIPGHASTGQSIPALVRPLPIRMLSRMNSDRQWRLRQVAASLWEFSSSVRPHTHCTVRSYKLLSRLSLTANPQSLQH